MGCLARQSQEFLGFPLETLSELVYGHVMHTKHLLDLIP